MQGLNVAASGLLADERWQQVVMNNVANASTPGFKESSGNLMSFPTQLEMRYSYGGNPSAVTPVGVMSHGALFQEAVGNFSQGMIQQTGQPLDLALQDPVEQGTAVFAAAPGAPGGAQRVNTLSFVVGNGGVVETAQGVPVVPVDSAGNPMTNARAIVNPKYKGLTLFGENGMPVQDAAGQMSYTLHLTNGAPVTAPGAFLRMTNAVTGGVRSFFAVANTDAQNVTTVALTRDGHFQVGANHLLYSATGQRVLAVGANGQPLLQSAVMLNPAYTGQNYFGPNGAPLHAANGQPSYLVVTPGGRPLAGAHFGAVGVDTGTLRALGATDFLPTAQTHFVAPPGTMQAGALEMGNVNGTGNAMQMLSIYQNYMADEKVAQTINSTLTSTVTSVGAVQGL